MAAIRVIIMTYEEGTAESAEMYENKRVKGARYKVYIDDDSDHWEASKKLVLETDDLDEAFGIARALSHKYKLPPYNFDCPGVLATYYRQGPDYRSITVVDKEVIPNESTS